MEKGRIYLIPTTIGGDNALSVIPSEVIDYTKKLRFFIVENIKTARRYLRKIDPSFPIDDSTFFILNKHTKNLELSQMLQPVYESNDIGILSEAGCPAVADPGGVIIALAHQRKIKVVPFVGPSSILLTLMGSGFSGQNFHFHGYLPRERKERLKKIKFFEANTKKTGTTHLFMDTPFRNENVFEDLLSHLMENSYLCIASNLTLPDESIQTKNIKEWKKTRPNLSKKPVMFALGTPEILK